ncbi:2-isopropylmalate synthase [Roseimicrobium sp. ORNL1]|uniref:2-isopropylmalate synthase n=1 Tax=Roseimicrobium sp. ORNL1 TaxID=2711231 RepID=UPI0013E201D3|nr:2-isopropylmalate synthase [Roseimicrobium sp. ORNL1]QIF02474.1 2-isopropylmalate synthase [Roseimicrobium sp. ORNL1]
MSFSPTQKYRPFPSIDLPNRQWPARVLTQAPIWCSVDLRDGNQALAVPMNVSQKLEMFEALVKCGFKEIEVGFPSASNTEFAFNRRLIEDGRIPDDVTIQCLVQAREDLIEKTVQSLMGAKSVIIHLYNSTSPAQRRYVFGMEKADIVKVAVRGAQWIKDRIQRLEDNGTKVMLQYSPESFSATEVEFAKEVSEAVMDVWQPTPERKMILNLPDTVEVAGPNVYADQIEWMCRNIKNRESLIISLHTHNDRGTGTAATEMGLLAGADRVEGTLFGNGERTGNLDIVQVAMNLYMHGIDPKLDFSDLNALREVYERCTGMTVPPRHPYSGELVFTAFSGSHQDAIKKGLTAYEGHQGAWDVPYLTIDPQDIGREYREVIRVNSQSGKGGVAYLLESEFGIELPKELQREFGPIANDAVDALGREVSAAELKAMFWKEYIERSQPFELKHFHADGTTGVFRCRASLYEDGKEIQVTGEGNGPIAAFVNAMVSHGVPSFEVANYREQSLGSGSEANALSFIQIKRSDGKTCWGAGVDTNIELASIKAVVSAVNRAL